MKEARNKALAREAETLRRERAVEKDPLTFAQRKELAESYRETLRQMKQKNLGVDDLPEELQHGFLELHQNALLVAGMEREAKKKEAKEKR